MHSCIPNEFYNNPVDPVNHFGLILLIFKSKCIYNRFTNDMAMKKDNVGNDHSALQHNHIRRYQQRRETDRAPFIHALFYCGLT